MLSIVAAGLDDLFTHGTEKEDWGTQLFLERTSEKKGANASILDTKY